MAIKVGIGVSIHKDPLQAAKEATEEAKSKLKEDVSIGFIFSSIEFAHPIVLKVIKDLIQSAPLIGCSGLAIISPQGILKRGLGIMLLNLPKDIYIASACVKQINTQPISDPGELLGENLMHGFKGLRRCFGMLFCDGFIPQSSTLISGLQKVLGKSFPLIGASASNTSGSLKSYLYFNQDIFNDGVCGLLWGGKLNFSFGIKHGWKPLGKPRTVTHSEGNIVYKIDGLPAVKLYMEYLGWGLDKLKRELKYISIFYPLGVNIPGQEEYLLRNILRIEEDGSLYLHGNIPEGSIIKLMIGTKESCLQATEQAVDETKRNLYGKSYDLVFVFNSLSRYILLGRRAKEEIKIIKEGLGKEVPLLGLYTLGEHAPLRAIAYQGMTYFHNQTVALLVIGG
ncbi:MAG: FIST C-terminal domain-containing protein [Candidatus Omnitrophica bacterium]|nr:FIST C-terminal domain-containing protein [Candidatus Omnitrophota bacterium]